MNEFVSVLVGYLGGMVIAAALVLALRQVIRSTGRRISRSRGADRPDWAPGIWLCATCLSTNYPIAMQCARCRRPREELVPDPIEPRPDWIPQRILVSDARIVSLGHDSRAHVDPGEAHWRLTVAGQIMGSAATRAGAAALLRAVDGADTVHLDVRGTGAAAYRLDDVIARFEAPRFPLDIACPERGAS